MVAVFVSGCATPEQAPPQPLNRETIRVNVASHLKEMQKCYEDALERRPGAEGKITISWTILDDGSVEHVRIKEISKKMIEAKTCALDTVKTWKFPKQPDSHVTDVDYPFFFSENGHYEGFTPQPDGQLSNQLDEQAPVGLPIPALPKD